MRILTLFINLLIGDLEYGVKLENIGIFERNYQKLYGSSWEFGTEYNKELYSKFYEGDIDKIGRELAEESDKLLNDYIKNKEELLERNAQKVWNEYIKSEVNYNAIKDSAEKKYIYGDEKEELKFSINRYKYERDNTIKGLLLEYLQFPEKTAHKVFDEYINNDEKDLTLYSRSSSLPDINVTVKERIGVRLLEKKLEDRFILDLENNPNNELKLKRDIIAAIKDTDIQNITINLTHNDKSISFKYPRNQLYNFYFSDYYIPNKDDRRLLKEIYEDDKEKGYYSDFRLEDITSITYRKQVIFEQKELENNKDITDEMFE